MTLKELFARTHFTELWVGHGGNPFMQLFGSLMLRKEKQKFSSREELNWSLYIISAMKYTTFVPFASSSAMWAESGRDLNGIKKASSLPVGPKVCVPILHRVSCNRSGITYPAGKLQIVLAAVSGNMLGSATTRIPHMKADVYNVVGT